MATLSMSFTGPYGGEFILSADLSGENYLGRSRIISDFISAALSVTSQIRSEKEQIERRHAEVLEQIQNSSLISQENSEEVIA